VKKLSSLRQHLVDACPALQRDPDQLLTFVERGSIRFHVGANLSHAYSFTAQIVLLDFGGDIDTVTIPLLEWLSIYQPDLQPDQAVTFEAEILKHDALDLAISVELTERVVVTTDAAGNHTAEHKEDPRQVEEYGPAGWELTGRDQYDGE
jgi:hypothetical protein